MVKSSLSQVINALKAAAKTRGRGGIDKLNAKDSI